MTYTHRKHRLNDEEENKNSPMVVVVCLLLALFLVIASFTIHVLRKPDEYSITKKIVIDASPDIVFGFIDDLHKWESWAPWTTLDPNISIGYEGPNTGYGSNMLWAGDINKVGVGNLVVTQSVPPDHATYDLNIEKPMTVNGKMVFHLLRQDAYTEVNLTIYGKADFWLKSLNCFFSLDHALENQMVIGLDNLKKNAEQAAL